MRVGQMIAAIIEHLNHVDKPYQWSVDFVESPGRDDYARHRGYYLHCHHPEELIKVPGKGATKTARLRWQQFLQGKSAGNSFIEVVMTICEMLIIRPKWEQWNNDKQEWERTQDEENRP